MLGRLALAVGTLSAHAEASVGAVVAVMRATSGTVGSSPRAMLSRSRVSPALEALHF